MSTRNKLKELEADWEATDHTKNDFEQVPKGEYNATIYDVEFTESSNENPMLKLQLAITDPEFEGRYLFDNIVFTPKTVAMSKAKLARLGMNVDKKGFLSELEDDCEQLRGKDVKVRVSYKANKETGDEWARIRYLNEEDDDEQDDTGNRAQRTAKVKVSKGKPVAKKAAPAKKARRF